MAAATESTNRTRDDVSYGTQPYPVAVVLSIFSLLAILVTIVPLRSQIRHCNVGGLALLLWLAIINFMGFINAIIWPHDDYSRWYKGGVLCDIEVRAHLAAVLGIAISLVLIFKGLADVLDVNKPYYNYSRTQKQRGLVVECLLCFGLPGIYIITYYIVQAGRYDIYGISGCQYLVDGTWVSIVVVSMWPLILNAVSAAFAVQTMYRLYRYSRSFHALIEAHNTTQARFVRLFTASLIIVLVRLPMSALAFRQNFPLSHEPFSWADVHDPEFWGIVELHRSFGKVMPESWSGTIGAFILGSILGTGAEASRQYTILLTALGFYRAFPGWKPDGSASHQPSNRKWSILSVKAITLWSKLRTSSVSSMRTDDSHNSVCRLDAPYESKQLEKEAEVTIQQLPMTHQDSSERRPLGAAESSLTRNWDLMFKDVFNPQSHLNRQDRS